MRILWFSWKDITHPQAGGAEIVVNKILTYLAMDGHKVILVASRYKGSKEKEEREGYKIHRVGSRLSVYWNAYRCYQKYFKNWAELVVDECNTFPFFSCRYAKCRSIMFFHQLCRDVWFYQIAWPFSWIGYMLEPIYLRWLNHAQVITVSQSTSMDLQRYGFKKENIGIISEGIEIDPLDDLYRVEKFQQTTLLSMGSVRPMKRTLDVLRAFELAKQKIPDLRLIIAGSVCSRYARKIKKALQCSPFSNSIEMVGTVNIKEKIELLRRSHLVAVASVKEGWCLVVTEANSQGTPAVAYNVDGLRDSVRDGETGWLTINNTPEDLAKKIVEAFSDEKKYNTIRYKGWLWSKEINFSSSYSDFIKVSFLDKQ